MHDTICYKKTFLKAVIVRLDFATPLTALQSDIPTAFVAKVSKHFPISEPVDGVTQELQFTNDAVTHKQTLMKQWVFHGKNREKQLTIAVPSLHITHSSYISFDDLRANVSAVVEAVNQSFPDTQVARFGLRYINSIDEEDPGSSPTNWDKFIDASLLMSPSFFADPGLLTRLVSIAELKHPSSDLDLRFQFGMPNADYPAVMRRREFILDFDAYVQTNHHILHCVQHMDDAHGLIQNLFEKSITPALKEIMS